MKKFRDQKMAWDTRRIMDELSQHDKFKIVISSSSPQYALPKHQYNKFLTPHRGEAYFFMFYEKGISKHRVDLQEVTISDGELLFVLPNQIHTSPPMDKGIEFFTLSFAQNFLSVLPQQYPFLINPFANPKIAFSTISKRRVINLFQMLNELLHATEDKASSEIIIAYINSLLTEFNNAYFKNANECTPNDDDVSKFIRFKSCVERDFKLQASIGSIAEELSISENGLYKIVKYYSGISPKEFLIQRLILEAQRVLFYDKRSVKELAHDLGFADPDYFSRLFKKQTGRSISQFLQYLQDLSGKHPN
jgi:AraC-like DNA-binding protein